MPIQGLARTRPGSVRCVLVAAGCGQPYKAGPGWSEAAPVCSKTALCGRPPGADTQGPATLIPKPRYVKNVTFIKADMHASAEPKSMKKY